MLTLRIIAINYLRNIKGYKTESECRCEHQQRFKISQVVIFRTKDMGLSLLELQVQA